MLTPSHFHQPCLYTICRKLFRKCWMKLKIRYKQAQTSTKDYFKDKPVKVLRCFGFYTHGSSRLKCIVCHCSFILTPHICCDFQLDNERPWMNPEAPVTGNPENYGTERDIANCPFFLKTGACRFGERYFFSLVVTCLAKFKIYVT